MIVSETLSSEQEHQIHDRTGDLLDLASRRLCLEIPAIELRFDLRGRAAGMYCSMGNSSRYIRFNPWLFSTYFQDNLANTVPHEVAHYLVDLCFSGRRLAPHGREWRAMMQLLGADPQTTHAYDLSGVPIKRQRRFLYHCSCQAHRLSATRHNRAQKRRGTLYSCLRCGEPLRYQGVEIKSGE